MFQVGRQVRCSGRVIYHWEWGRFEVRRPAGWLPLWSIRCELVNGEQLPGGPWDLIGQRLPGNWDQHAGLVFAVTADLTPLEHGWFGHRGMQHWRLRVDRWVSVKRLRWRRAHP